MPIVGLILLTTALAAHAPIMAAIGAAIIAGAGIAAMVRNVEFHRG